jgi:hypothetical protein
LRSVMAGLRLSDRLTQTAVRGARLRPDRLRCRAYGGDHSKGVVYSGAKHKWP